MSDRLPNGWDGVRLRDVLVPVRRSSRPVVGTTYRLLGVKLYGAGCHVHEQLDGSQIKAPTLNELHAGDIVYNKMWASKGTFAVVGEEYDGCWASSEYPVFGPKASLDTSYLRFVLCRPRFWKLADDWSKGTTDRARLNPGDFLLMPILRPPLDEQRAIAAILVRVERLCALSRQVIEQLQRTKFWTMRELLTGGHPDYRTSLVPLTEPWPVGRIAPNVTHRPAHWKLTRLTSLSKLETGHTPGRDHPEYWEGEIPWISLPDVQNLSTGTTISETVQTIAQSGVANSSARVLPAGTVVLLRTAAPGACSIMGRPMSTSQHFANWVCGGQLDAGYLLQVFRHMGREWIRLQAGSVLPDIYMPDFKKLQILLPKTLEEQRRIAAIGEGYDHRLAHERMTLAQLEQLQAALSQALLIGRKRCPPALIARLNDLAPSAPAKEVAHASA